MVQQDVTSLCQALAIRLSTKRITREGRELDQRDFDLMMTAVNLQINLLCDLSHTFCEQFDPTAALYRYIDLYGTTDLVVIMEAFKQLSNDFRNDYSSCIIEDYCGWKAHTSTIARLVIQPVRPVLDHYLLKRDCHSLGVLLQWCCFLERVTLVTGFEEDASDFMSHNSSLAWSPEWDSLREVMVRLCSSYNNEEFEPRFSSGATAVTPRAGGHWLKWKNLRFSPRHAYLLRSYGWNIVGDCAHVPCARLVSVPKGINKRRYICADDPGSAFLQQGVWRNLDQWFATDPVLRDHIKLHDQSVQRTRAQEAAWRRNAATIDLSAASDSVRFALVKYCLKGTKLWRDLLCCRTDYVRLFDGSVVPLHMFAPMGSAVCFPVECLVFLSICILGCETTGTPTKLVGVYGDDLIVPQPAEAEIRRLLAVFGFEVNADKSFSAYDGFKESCGGEFADGEEVTPLRLSRNFSSQLSPKAYEGWVELANQLYLRQYFHTRRAVLELCLRNTGALFTRRYSGRILSPFANNHHLQRRWNSDLHRWEVKALLPDLEVTYVADDECRYIETLIALRDTNRQGLFYPEDLIQVRLPVGQKSVFRWGWVEEELSTSTYPPH